MKRQDPSELPARYDYDIDTADNNRSHTKILKLLKPGQVVLEIGCATGYMTRYMKSSLQCRVVAVEIDGRSAEKARPFCDELVVGDIESLSLETILAHWQFDVIVMADVIEHLTHPAALLDKLKPLLKDAGYLLLSIPNGTHGALALELLDGKWEYRETGLMDRTHLHFYDKESLSDLLESCGWYVAQLDRVVIHPRDTEMNTPWDRYPREVTAYLEKVNPEYKTYQFIVKAHPMSIGGWRKGLEDALSAEQSQVAELTGRLEKTETRLQFFQGERNNFQDELKKREKEYLANLDREISRLEGEKTQLHQDYQAHISRLDTEISDLHRDYRCETDRLEAEITEIHTDYRTKMDTQSSRERKRYHTWRLTKRNMERLEDEKAVLERLYEDRQYELATIRQSVAWRIMDRHRRAVDRWLPENTRRRRLYRLSVLAPVVLVKEGPASFVKKIIRRCRFWKKPVLPDSDEHSSETAFAPLVFPTADIARVSIVIPVFNQVGHTFRCLSSLLAHSRIALEIIVVNNASSDGTGPMLEAMSGIRVIDNKENLGFVHACNKGASEARGDYLLFLNNDTEVTDGWLEALLTPFEDDTVGIVGARLVYPDGRLQEAGNIIWQDGSGWNVGRGDDPELPEYNYLRDVDYCSGACMMIPRHLWQTIGGFDTRFAPAYYEDTDLCFSVRDKGYRVVYQPASRVIHYEGMTAGTDVSFGFKRYQVINRKKFIEKWEAVLRSNHYPGPDHLYLARERVGKLRALVVDHYAPQFDKDSGSLRMFSLIQILQDLNYKVVFWPDNRAFDDRYTTQLQQMGVEAMYGDIHFDRYLKHHGRFFDMIILSRPYVAINYMDAAIAYSDAMIIYDTVDLHCLRESRRAKLEMDNQCRMDAERCAAQWKEKELYLARTADVTFVVSPVEKEILEKEDGLKGKVVVVSNIHPVEACRTPFEEREGLMFIGGFMHSPNEDGVLWFVESILPLVREQLPNVHLYVVGSHPTERVNALSSESVTVTGYVEDVSPYFEQSRVFVCPLRYGAGVKGKIGQSVAFGLPVITTAVGAEGMGLVDGTNALIADDETLFAQKIIRLYREKALWATLSKNGIHTIEEKFSMEVTRKTLDRLVRSPD